MPAIKEGESEEEYVKRCISYVVSKEGGTPKQAAAKCHGMYKEHEEKGTQYDEPIEFSFSVPMIKTIETDYEANQTPSPTKENRAVALIGDMFYRGQFLPASELEKAHMGWENTLHDINHMGTTHIQGLTATSDILYFIGYNKNVSYDEKNKAVSMDIVPKYDTFYGKAWKAYVDLVEEAGGIPNVSVHFDARIKRVKASELPEGVNYDAYGYGKDDYVDYIYDIVPGALSTVFRGACNDAMGCGIGKTSDHCDCENDTNELEEPVDITKEKQEKERQELIDWLKEHE